MLRQIYDRYSGLADNPTFARFVSFQHRHAPIPLRAFDLLFSTLAMRRILQPYATAAFRTDYASLTDHADYWLSDRSLYWHFWQQTNTEQRIIELIRANPDLLALLTGGHRIVELGFGLGSMAKTLHKAGLLRYASYTAVECNAHLCAYLRRHPPIPGLEVVKQDIGAFDRKDFDVLIAHRGVFQYVQPALVRRLFSNLPSLKGVLVTHEGSTDGDVLRKNGTTMYDFKRLLPGRRYVEVKAENGHLLLFAMTSAS